MLVLISAVLLLAATATPVAARQVVITLSGNGDAAVVGCTDGSEPPCADTVVVSFAGMVSGSPFNDVKGVKDDSAIFTGTLEIPTATVNPGCYSDVIGTFALAVPRGQSDRLAFEIDAMGSFCFGSFTGTFTVDSSGARVSAFRDSTGSGTLLLVTNLDVSTSDEGVFTVNMNGVMAVTR